MAGRERQHRAHARVEKGVEAALGIPSLRLLGEGDRPLGQAFEDEVVEGALLGELDGGLDPVAGVAGARSDVEGSNLSDSGAAPAAR